MDEGACAAPIELAPSILVSHWGRTQAPPGNHTTIAPGHGWHVEPYVRRMYGSNVCYDPRKDLLLPVYLPWDFVSRSPYLTGQQPERNVLFMLRGDALSKPKGYSLGLRQELHLRLIASPDSCDNLPVPGCVLVGHRSPSYVSDLQRSTFCGVMPGNGWGHIEEPLIHGCIPVIIMPGIHVQLEGVVNVNAFSIRLERPDLPHLVQILRAVPPATIKKMQAEARRIWTRYTYSGNFEDRGAAVKSVVLGGADAVHTFVEALRTRLDPAM